MDFRFMEEIEITEMIISEEERGRKTAPDGMPIYDINEPWVRQYIEDFGEEPSFF